MAGGHASGGGDPGGRRIPASRETRSRLILAGAALAPACAIAAYPALSASRLAWIPWLLGAGGLCLLAAALAARRAGAVPWALALLGAEYGVWLALRGGEVDTRSPLAAAGLLLVAELAYDGLAPGALSAGPELVARRVVVLAVLALGAVAVSAVVIAAAAVPLEGGVALTAAGVVAATLALGLLARLSGRHR